MILQIEIIQLIIYNYTIVTVNILKKDLKKKSYV